MCQHLGSYCCGQKPRNYFLVPLHGTLKLDQLICHLSCSNDALWQAHDCRSIPAAGRSICCIQCGLGANIELHGGRTPGSQTLELCSALRTLCSLSGSAVLPGCAGLSVAVLCSLSVCCPACVLCCAVGHLSPIPRSVAEIQPSHELLEGIAAHIRGHVSLRPTLGVICGTGLGGLAEQLQGSTVTLHYKDIPDFPQVSGEGGACGRG